MTSDTLRLCLRGLLLISKATSEPAMDLLDRIWPERKPPQSSTELFIERRKAA